MSVRQAGLFRGGFRRLGTAAGEGEGGADVSLDDEIKARISDLMGGATSFPFWSEPFMVFPGDVGSAWQAIGGTHPRMVPGGVLNVYPASLGASVIVRGTWPPASRADQPGFFGDLTVAPGPWLYCFARFSFCPTDGTGNALWAWDPGFHAVSIGWTDPLVPYQVAGIGIAQAGPGNGNPGWGPVGGDMTSRALQGETLIPRDVESGHIVSVWHDGELFRIAGRWYASVDGSAVIDCTDVIVSPNLQRACPAIWIGALGGLVLPAVSIDHVAFASEPIKASFFGAA